MLAILQLVRNCSTCYAQLKDASSSSFTFFLIIVHLFVPAAFCLKIHFALFRGKPQEKCPLCQAVYTTEQKGKICLICKVRFCQSQWSCVLLAICMLQFGIIIVVVEILINTFDMNNLAEERARILSPSTA